MKSHVLHTACVLLVRLHEKFEIDHGEGKG